MARIQVRAVLCDLDGTLADSGDGVIRAWSVFATHHDLDADKILAKCHGVRTAELIAEFAPELGAGSASVEVEALVGELGGQPILGAQELTSLLPKGGWALVTSSSRFLAESRFKPPMSLPRPEVLVTAEDVQVGKPDPAGYLLAAERLGVPPASCLVIEDAPAGVSAGKRAGMLVAGVSTTHKAEQLVGADFVVADPTRIRVLAALTRPGGGWDISIAIDKADS